MFGVRSLRFERPAPCVGDRHALLRLEIEGDHDRTALAAHRAVVGHDALQERQALRADALMIRTGAKRISGPSSRSKKSLLPTSKYICCDTLFTWRKESMSEKRFCISVRIVRGMAIGG